MTRPDKSAVRDTHPWDEWFDGEPHVAEQGLDFEVDPRDFRTKVNRAARRHGLVVETKVVGSPVNDDEGLWMQAVAAREVTTCREA